MKRMNLGCGPDIKEGWYNFDLEQTAPEVIAWDCRIPMPEEANGTYDFILVNHVFCTMDHSDVDKALKNLYQILKPGGKIQVIDLDLIMAFAFYEQGSEDMIPASGNSIDHKFVNHISGFGTRRSLYTQPFLMELLAKHNFKDIEILGFSEYDLRPNESLIGEATK